jgi:hypothetical protein
MNGLKLQPCISNKLLGLILIFFLFHLHNYAQELSFKNALTLIKKNLLSAHIGLDSVLKPFERDSSK